MQSYFDLLKNNIIDFNRILLDKYHYLGLNETETIILMKLNNLLLHGEKSIMVFSNVPAMSISENECSVIIIELVKRGFITMEISSVDSKEVFSLDETYRKLGFILEGQDEEKTDEIKELNLETTLKTLEKELQIMLSPNDVKMVRRWFFDDSYTYNEINEGILEALKNKRRGIAFIDRYLFKKHSPEEKVDANNQLESMFKKVYAKNGQK